MELIVVIVILAILAAILIPGLLKWIDQAKDKKYELEAREIALAAEAALAQMYGQGAGALDLVGGEEDRYLLEAGGSTNLMKYSPFSGELGKFTDAEKIKEIEIYGNADGGTSGKWGGSATGFEITFTPSGETEPITASLLPGSDRWVISKSSDGTGGESGDKFDKFDTDADPKVREANAVWKVVKALTEQTEGIEFIHHPDGSVTHKFDPSCYDQELFLAKLGELTPPDVGEVWDLYIWGEKFEIVDGIEEKPWDGKNIDRLYISYGSLDGTTYTYAKYYSSSDSWYYYVNPDYEATLDAWYDEAQGYVTP